MKGIALGALEQLMALELKNLRESRDADFNDHRVTHSAKTANALARFLLLEELAAAAVNLADKSKGVTPYRDGAPRQDDTLDL